MPALTRSALAATAGALALVAGAPGSAGATFTIAPSSSHHEATVGGSAFGSFSVLTRGMQGHVLDIDVAELGESAHRGVAVTRRARTREWLRASPHGLRVTRGRHRVRWELAVPPGAEPGDHVFAVVVTARPRGQKGTHSAARAIAHRLTVRVPGAIRRDVAVTSLTAPGVVGGGPVTATAQLINRGNVSVDLGKARFAVVGGGRDLVRAKLDGSLVPGGSRRISLTWDDPPRLGRARVEAQVPGAPPVARTITVVPWRQGAALALLATALLIVARLAKGRVRFQVIR